MKQYSRVITLVGGVVALISFAFPWADKYSGYELINISSLSSDVGFVLLVFIVTWFIIVTSLVLNRQTLMKVKISKIMVTICSGIGLFCFFILFFGEKWNVRIYGRNDYEIQYGAFINAIGFIIAIVGIWKHPTTGDLSDSDEG